VTGAIKYVIDPMQPFPKKWSDNLGPINVMTEPVSGFVMVRRPGCTPFILSVKQLLNAEPTRSMMGPFVLFEKKTPTVAPHHGEPT